jgi:hypothetical protein
VETHSVGTVMMAATTAAAQQRKDAPERIIRGPRESASHL